jgi:hypothetical protein
MGPPRLGIIVPAPRPAVPPDPAAITAAPPPVLPTPLPQPVSAPVPRARPFYRRRLGAGLAAAILLVLCCAAFAAYTFWPRAATSPQPDEQLALAPHDTSLLSADGVADDLQGALAADDEEWLDDRPMPNGPADPAQPPVGVPTNIDIPPMPDNAVAPPPLPDASASAKFKRRDNLSEEQARRLLAHIPEIGLDRTLLPSLVWEYREQQETSLTAWGCADFEPRPLRELYPGVKALGLRHGKEAQLDPRRAATLDALSRKLRVYVSHFAPPDRQGKRPGAAQLRQVMYNEMRGSKPEWLRPEAIPVLMQMLTPEDALLRHLLVEILSEIKHRTATVALAQRAACDLDANVRAFAVEALRSRPRDDYLDVFLRALRHPQALLADHAAEALVALDMKEAIPALVTMLKEPDPTAPYADREGRLLVREVVRTNHLANCLLCHPPSVTYQDPVPGVIPNAKWLYPVIEVSMQSPTGRSSTSQQLVSRVNGITSQTTSTGTTSQTGCHDYSASTGIVPNVTVPSSSPGVKSARASRRRRPSQNTVRAPAPRRPARPQENVTIVSLPVLVRGDVTYLRQDFSVTQPVPDVVNGQPTSVNMRFDYFVRLRRATPEEVKPAVKTAPLPSYDQREAVLFALRQLTGKDGGSTTEGWQRLYPDAEEDGRAQRLAGDLVRTKGDARQRALERLRDGKGTVYTEALAAAAGRLSDESRDRVRDALVQRLTRMTAATLRNKLSEESAEVRRAAALACARKEDPAHVPDLVERLDDSNAAVARAARRALSTLTGEEFNTPEQWKEWWQKQGTE